MFRKPFHPTPHAPRTGWLTPTESHVRSLNGISLKLNIDMTLGALELWRRGTHCLACRPRWAAINANESLFPGGGKRTHRKPQGGACLVIGPQWLHTPQEKIMSAILVSMDSHDKIVFFSCLPLPSALLPSFHFSPSPFLRLLPSSPPPSPPTSFSPSSCFVFLRLPVFSFLSPPTSLNCYDESILTYA